MRIGDRATYTGSRYPWAAGHIVEIKGVVRGYRTFKEVGAEIGEADQVIFSLTDNDGFRCSVPDARVGDFEEAKEKAPAVGRGGGLADLLYPIKVVNFYAKNAGD